MTDLDELEVHVTPDGLGPAGIVRRADGFLCIFVKWKIPNDGRHDGLLVFGPEYLSSWFDDHTPPSILYFGSCDQEPDQNPESGIYGTIDDARRELYALPGFADAVLKPSAKFM